MTASRLCEGSWKTTILYSSWENASIRNFGTYELNEICLYTIFVAGYHIVINSFIAYCIMSYKNDLFKSLEYTFHAKSVS